MAFGFGRAGGATVRLAVDDAAFNRDLTRDASHFRRTTSGMQNDLGKLGRGALAGSGAFHGFARSIAFASGAFLGGAGLVSVLKSSVSAASDLTEQINKTNVVFRGSQAAVLKWSETTATGLGIARGQALGFAATFGNLLVPMGLTRKAAANMSVGLVKLAADLASFNNANPEDVLRALQSGLAGQVRPLRQFGIFLDQNRIKAEALRLGLVKGVVSQQASAVATEKLSIAQAKYNQALKDFGPGTTQVASAHVTLVNAQNAVRKAAEGVRGELTQQQKVLATHSIIMRDSRDAQNDFARTSGGLANQQRILRAQITELEEKLGKALMPTILRITKSITAWLGQSKNQKKIQDDLNSAVRIAGKLFGALRDTVDALSPVVRTLNRAVGGTTNAFKILFALAIASKLRGIGLAMGMTQGGLAASAATATTKTGLLAANLRSLRSFGAITIEILILEKILSSPNQGRGSKYGSATIHYTDGSTEEVVIVGAKSKTIVGKDGKVYYLHPNGDYYAQRPGKPGPGGLGSNIIGAAQSATATSAQKAVVATALQYGPGSGITYTWGGTSPQEGFDCSGFLQYVYAKHGIKIPHNTVAQFHDPNAINSTGREQPGDGVYFRTGGPGGAPQHCGFYLGGGRFIEYFSRGKPAKFNTIGAKGGYMGARRWLKVQSSSGGGGTPPAQSGGTPAQAGDLRVGTKTGSGATGPDVPLVLQEKLARAQLTKGLDDDLKVLTEIEDYLVKRIAKTKSIKKRVQLLKELGSVRKQIASLSEKLPKSQRGFIQIGGPGGDLGTKTVTDPTAKPGQQTINIPGIGKILVGTEQAPTLSQIRDTIVEIYNKIVAAISRRDAKVAALKKLRKVRRPNARQQAAIKRLVKDIDALNKIIEDLKADLGQYIGAANDLAAEMAADEEAKAKESEGSPGSGPEDSVGDAGVAAGSITDIPTGLSYQLAQGQFAGDIGLQTTALRAEEQVLLGRLASTTDPGQRIELMNAIMGIRENLASAATATSPAFQLQQAQARLTPGTADDLALTRSLKDIIEARLKEAHTIGEQIALTNQLADLKAQLNDQQGQENAELIAYLNARRELARTYASNVLGQTFGAGSQITVQNFNQPTPDDPHLWSQTTMFELRALVS